jgi:hypothetical protein
MAAGVAVRLRHLAGRSICMLAPIVAMTGPPFSGFTYSISTPS